MLLGGRNFHALQPEKFDSALDQTGGLRVLDRINFLSVLSFSFLIHIPSPAALCGAIIAEI
jgi:hypothetical protein